MRQKKWDFHISANSDSYLGTCDGRTYITISDKPSVPEEHKSTQLEIAAFIDQSKDPQHYIDRYFNESKYKQWFDENYPQYISIYEAVGLEEPVKVIEELIKELPELIVPALVIPSKEPQHYIIKYQHL